MTFPRTSLWAGAAAAIAASSTSPVHSFTLDPLQSNPRANLHKLCLVPGQGSQLVAAFNAASAAHEKKDEVDDNLSSAKTDTKAAESTNANVNSTPATPKKLPTDEERSISLMAKLQPARAVMSRIFSLPHAIMGRHPAAAPALVDLPREDLKDDVDVVLYPIVGFRFVKNTEGDTNGNDDGDTPKTRVLPTTTHASCPIYNLPDQEVYGWYCTACRLDSIYSDTYCDEPTILIENNLVEPEQTPPNFGSQL